MCSVVSYPLNRRDVKGRTIQDNINLVRMIIEKVEKAVMINLDQFKGFDRVDHSLLEAVLFAARFKLYFCSWINLLYADLGASKQGKIETLHLVQNHSSGLPPFPPTLERFLCKLRANPVIGEISLPGATASARYTDYADTGFTLVTSSSKIDKVGREIQFMRLTGAMIKCDKSVGLWFCPCTPQFDGWLVQETLCLVRPQPQAVEELSEVLNEVVAAVNL